MVLRSPLRYALPAVLLGAAFFSGCGWQDKPKNTGMQVSADFRDVHRCSRISPEIEVLNPPKETAYYRVRLNRAGDDQALLGTGNWAFDGVDEDGKDVIPEGALTGHYRGPCPAAGSSGRYVFTVSAMPRDSNTPLSERTYEFVVE